MCNIYTLISEDDIEELRTIIPGFRRHTPSLGENHVVTPGMEAPILTQHGDLLNAMWGFKKWDGKGVIFNARSETLESSGFFAPHIKLGRCVAPAVDYFEWRIDPDEPKKKIKYRISDSKRRIIYLCALMRPAGGSFEYTVVTAPAASDILYIHPRMPLALDAEGARKWLEVPELGSLKTAVRLSGEETG